jgi:hypothetical protein
MQLQHYPTPMQQAQAQQLKTNNFALGGGLAAI